MNIQILVPDSPKNIMGGMGVQLANNLKFFNQNYYFNIIGSDSESNDFHGSNFSFKSIEPFRKIYGNSTESIYNPFLNQNSFIKKSFEFSKKPDLIHAFDWGTFMPAMFLSDYYKVPLIVTIQLSIKNLLKSYNLNSHSNPVYKIPEMIEIEGLNRADAIIQVSDSYAKQSLKFFWPKTYVIENGIDLNEWTVKNKIDLPGENKYKIIYIGRIDFQKNIQTLLEIDIPDNIDLIIIGGTKGSSEDLLQKVIAKSQNCKNFIYVGTKYDQEKVDWLFASDGVIMPSIHEPFGIVALEALASKNVLLTSFVDGLNDFLKPDIAINCGITKESIQKSLNLFLNLSEEEKSSRISKGLELCKSYNWRNSALKLESVYKKLKN
jgi:glycogen(starch) synthase